MLGYTFISLVCIFLVWGALRVFVFTLGFHEDYAIRLLTSSSASFDDKVVILTGSPLITATKKAIEGLKTFTTRIGIGEPLVVEVPPSVNEGISTILKVFSYDAEYVLGLSGGTGYLIVFTLIALVLSGRNAKIYIHPEGSNVPEILIDKYVLTTLRRLPTEAELRVLNEIVKTPGITDEEIAIIIGRKVKTVRNIVTELNKSGLIIKRGRRGGIYPTEWGKVIALINELKN